MKKLITCIASMLIAIGGYAQNLKKNAFFHDKGLLFEVESYTLLTPLCTYPYPSAFSAGYKMGNGFDFTCQLGWNCYKDAKEYAAPKLPDDYTGLVFSNYIQARYHFLNRKFSPYAATGVGLNVLTGPLSVFPSAKISVGLSYQFLSLYLGYVQCLAVPEKSMNYFERRNIIKFGMTISF